MSKKFEKVKNYYDCELWTIHRVHDAVLKDWITTEEFEIITGVAFSEYIEE